MNRSTAFHLKKDGQVDKAIQTSEDILRSYVLKGRGSWVDHLPLIDFAYNNSYHISIGIYPFEAIYGIRCRSLIRWFEDGENRLYGSNLVY